MASSLPASSSWRARISVLVSPGIVRAGQGLGALHRVAPPRFLEQLLPPDAPLGLLEVELVKPAHQRIEVALCLPEIDLDGLAGGHLTAVGLGDVADLGLAAIALRRGLPRQGVGPFPLAAELLPALGELGSPPHRLVELDAVLALELPQPIDVSRQGLHALGDRRQLHPAGRHVGDQGALRLAVGVERRAELTELEVERALARLCGAQLDLHFGEPSSRFGALLVDLLVLDGERLEMAPDTLLLALGRLDVLVVGEARRLLRLAARAQHALLASGGPAPPHRAPRAAAPPPRPPAAGRPAPPPTGGSPACDRGSTGHCRGARCPGDRPTTGRWATGLRRTASRRSRPRRCVARAPRPGRDGARRPTRPRR